MARLITAGAEFGIDATSSTVTGAGPDGATFFSGTAPTRDVSIVRPGGSLASYKLPATTGGWSAMLFPTAIAKGNTIYIRFYFQFSAAMANQTSSVGCAIASVDDASGNQLITLRAVGTNQLQIYGASSTAYGSQSATLSTGTWYRIDMVVNIAVGSSATGGFAVNNTVVTSYSTAIGAGPYNAIARTMIGNYAVGGTFSVDDVVINDSTGAAQNTVPTDSTVLLALPVSDSANTGFTAGAGGAASLYLAVNHVPPTGVIYASATNTSQIKDATLNFTDSYAAQMQSFATAGASPNSTINGAQAFVYHGSSGSSGNSAGVAMSSPTAAEVTAANSGLTGTWPTGWAPITTVPVSNPVVSASTAPIVTYRRNNSTASMAATFMGVSFDYTVGPQPLKRVMQAVQRSAVR